MKRFIKLLSKHDLSLTGGESLAVAQNTYAVSWFQGRELNMVFGLQLSFSRVGSTVNMNVMGPLYEYIQVPPMGILL